jgi:hypothetical protein
VETEELAVRAAVRTGWQPFTDRVKLVIVRSTKYLETMYMSKAAIESAEPGTLEVAGDFIDVPFDAEGKLMLF